MSIIIFAIIVLIVVALLVWAVDYAGLGDPPARLIKLLIIVLGALLILNRAGIV